MADNSPSHRQDDPVCGEHDVDAFGIYVHWPYCSAICPYCDFNVYRARGPEGRAADGDALVDAICKDIAHWRSVLGPRRGVDTIFFGGGTPSLAPIDGLARIITAVDNAFGLDTSVRAADVSLAAEISLEANPEHITPQLVADLKTIGINRLSLGAQSLDDAALAALGRAHSGAMVREALATCLAVIDNTSLDLIYGRHGQTLAGWEEELADAAALGAAHISAYQLTIEPGTAFEKQAARGTIVTPDGDQSAAFFASTHDILSDAGYAGYEISNFSRIDEAFFGRHQARHNRIYWQSGEWLGVGPGAHGRVWLDGQRHASEAARRPGAYINAVSSGRCVSQNLTALSAEECGQEYVLMGLRLAEGIGQNRFARLAGAPLDAQILEDLHAEGLIGRDEHRVWVTAKHRALTGRIATELAPG